MLGLLGDGPYSHLVGVKGVGYLLLGHLQEARRPEGGADAEEREGRVLRLTVLPAELLDLTSDIQPLGGGEI